jgi:MFS family permease
MQLFCPACNAAYFGETRCPRCGGLLLMPHEVAPDKPPQLEAPPPHVQPTAVGRIVFGTVLALGVYLGLRKLLAGVILAATQVEAGGWWMSLQGLSAVYAVQIIAVLFGGVVAAAGRTYGYSLGFIVGGVCGGCFLGFELLAGAPPQTLVLYLQPPVLALLGLLAGTFGSRVWLPAPVLNIPLPTGSKLSSLQLGDDLAEEQPRPTWWIRILAGATIMVIGVAFSDNFRSTLQRNSGGFLRVESLGQAEFITWQFATLMIMIGGVFAAAGTGAGIRHGLLAGMVGAAGVFAACHQQGQALPPIYYYLVRMSLDELALTNPTVLAAICTGVVTLATLGGWLGGTLFPPLAPEYMRKRLQVGLD